MLGTGMLLKIPVRKFAVSINVLALYTLLDDKAWFTLLVMLCTQQTHTLFNAHVCTNSCPQSHLML